MAFSPALSAYLGATSLLESWAARKIEARAQAGKEDRQRLGERFGQAGLARPAGALVWFHAASVGESLSILELLNEITRQHPQLNILITTGTRSSAQLMSVRLPPGVLHQYVPVDTRAAVGGFLDHWRPDLAIWTESELWPRLVTTTASFGIPMLLVNGRISAGSARRWRFLPGMARRLMTSFDAILVQDNDIAQRFLAIGAEQAKLHVTGSLKEGTQPLPADETALAGLQKAIGRRPVWLAASTHEGEEDAVLAAHHALGSKVMKPLLILAPRHPERGEAVAGLASKAGCHVARRSRDEPLLEQTQVYVADTLGEMGLWYRLAPVSFVGRIACARRWS